METGQCRSGHVRAADVAHELGQLLGIGRVPPTVGRRLEGVTGTLQIWVEETMPEIELAERDTR